jgi:sigma-70-like protein
MDTGADAMPVPDRLRARWRTRGTASDVGDPSASVADDVLLVRVADGDTAALTALYRRYGGRLFAFLQCYAGDPMVAEEILQDTLLAVWRSAPRYAGRSGVRTWLFGIARRQAHNRLRGQGAATAAAGRPRRLGRSGSWAGGVGHRQRAGRSDRRRLRCARPAAPRGAGAGVRGPGPARGDRGGPGRAGGHGEEPVAPRPCGVARSLADRGYVEEMP